MPPGARLRSTPARPLSADRRLSLPPGAVNAAKMDSLQAMDRRKVELLEARFAGNRVSDAGVRTGTGEDGLDGLGGLGPS